MQSYNIYFSSHSDRLHYILHTVHQNYRFSGVLESRDQQMEKTEDHSHLGISGCNMDLHCPVCLHISTFPVKTNCGHQFCAPCLISYWKHSRWLDAISCPLCRQKVSIMYHLFHENRTDRNGGDILSHITDYNRRYSGAPRKVCDYLCDAPLFLLLLFRALGNMGVLVWLFLIRVALCGFGAAASLVSPLEAIPGAFSGALGLLDDLVVVFLLLMSIINIQQQMVPERTARTHTETQGILSDTL